MAQIYAENYRNGKATAWVVRRLPMPDGCMRTYRREGQDGLREIIRQYFLDRRAMEDGLPRKCL